MTNNEIILDEKSGIPIEEQKEILTQINGIAENYRRQLSTKSNSNSPETKNKTVVNSRKSGVIFPLAVNIAAVILLLGGAILLFAFNGRIDAQLKTGSAVYNLTERALIDEIRRETAERIAAKETEISMIVLRLEELDAQLLQLQSQDMSSEQLIAQENLLILQRSYRNELTVLQEDRMRILEDSRSREAHLRTALDERTREFAIAQQRTMSELDSAINELERLTNERDRLSALDALFSGGFAVLMQNAHLDQGDNSDLLLKTARLENTIAEMQKTIDAFNDNQNRTPGELEATITSLRNTNSTLEQSAAEKDRTISSLETEKTQLTHSVTALQEANTAQEQRIVDLNNQLTAIRQLLQDN
jgi:chromosome segregation ATPase